MNLLSELMNPLATDQKTIAERQWRAGLKPSTPQQPLDTGLFGDDARQIDLFSANKGK